MIDIILCSHAEFQMHIIVNGSDDIFLCNVLRDQVVNVSADQSLKLLLAHILCFLEEIRENRIEYRFCNTDLCRIKGNVCTEIDHKVGKDFLLSLLCLNPDIRDRSVLDRNGLLFCHHFSGLGKDFAGCGIYHILCQYLAGNTVFQVKLFIEFISSDLGKIISSRIEEHAVEQALRTVNRQRLARTDLFV